MSDVKTQLSQLNKMSKKSVAFYHKAALSMGISDSALGVLYVLLEADAPLSQYDICSEWHIPKQTINTTISSLQKRGFVTLCQISGTRNKKNISLTVDGKVFAEKTVGKLREAELLALSELSPEQRALYIEINETYNKSLTEKLDGLFKR